MGSNDEGFAVQAFLWGAGSNAVDMTARKEAKRREEGAERWAVWWQTRKAMSSHEVAALKEAERRETEAER